GSAVRFPVRARNVYGQAGPDGFEAARCGQQDGECSGSPGEPGGARMRQSPPRPHRRRLSCPARGRSIGGAVDPRFSADLPTDCRLVHTHATPFLTVTAGPSASGAPVLAGDSVRIPTSESELRLCRERSTARPKIQWVLALIRPILQRPFY